MVKPVGRVNGPLIARMGKDCGKPATISFDGAHGVARLDMKSQMEEGGIELCWTGFLAFEM